MAIICPVCNKKTGVFNEVYKQGVAIHGKCVPEFDKDPDKYVGKSEAERAQSVAEAEAEERQQKNEDKSVYVKGFDMPFEEMVIFMVKWALASIPAFIILAIIGAIFFAIFGSIFRSIFF